MHTIPKISVITVCLNAKQIIEKTIKTVLNQSYQNLEYIIIDGNSKDGTLDIIRKYEKQIAHWISEKDRGIYDAMNKGTQLATGEWIIYMNAGDEFNSNEIVENVFAKQKNRADMIYGDSIMLLNEHAYLRKSRPISSLWRGMCFSHQAVFIATTFAKDNLYDLHYKISADFDLIYKAYLQNKTFHYIPIAIVKTLSGGFSEINKISLIKERLTVLKKYNQLNSRIYSYHLFTMLDALVIFSLQKIISKKWLEYLILLRKKLVM